MDVKLRNSVEYAFSGIVLGTIVLYIGFVCWLKMILGWGNDEKIGDD